MTMLHTVNKSPFERNALDACLRTAIPGGSVLLIEDGVYASLRNTTASGKIHGAMRILSIYVLDPDLKARGYGAEHVVDGVRIVDYDGFVDLVVQHDSVQAWL